MVCNHCPHYIDRAILHLLAVELHVSLHYWDKWEGIVLQWSKSLVKFSRCRLYLASPIIFVGWTKNHGAEVLCAQKIEALLVEEYRANWQNKQGPHFELEARENQSRMVSMPTFKPGQRFNQDRCLSRLIRNCHCIKRVCVLYNKKRVLRTCTSISKLH